MSPSKSLGCEREELLEHQAKQRRKSAAAPNGRLAPVASACTQTGNSLEDLASRPEVAGPTSGLQADKTVRFVEGLSEESVKAAAAAEATEASEASEREEEEEDGELLGLELVKRLFELPKEEEEEEDPKHESPMDSAKFKLYGYKLIDYICNYLDTIRRRRVTPVNIEPGYLKGLIEAEAPRRGQSFARIMHDFESKIMRGITHWQHPHFHAYFPAGNAFPSILADMLSDALGCVGFSWAASPAYTELELIMLDWMGKMIGLPDEFLCLASGSSKGDESKGGGVIQGSASECVLVNLLAARHWCLERLRRKYPGQPDGLLLAKLIGYCSKEAHSCVEKAAMIGLIRMRALDTDERHSLRGATLARAIQQDRQAGLEPFIVCATLGTTSCVSFDNLLELGQVCRAEGELWLHVDAAYAGSALICPEFKHLMAGIELATSFNMNPNKWLLINFDCSLMWVKDRFKLTRAFVVDPLYLQHSYSDQAIDYRHWGVPLSRRFRALKLWFVIRNYGVEGLQAYIRNHCRLAKLFERLIRQDARFMVTNEVVLGLVCFRLIGSNALNQRLLSMINASGRLHMVPASLKGRYIIRFCVCDQNARDSDIHYAYKCIAATASELFDSIRAGRERIRAISQQNTIDVSSVSLHGQQSASADRLAECSAAAAAACEPVAEAQARPATSGEQAAGQEQDEQLAIDSLASIDGQDYDLELDDDEEEEEEEELDEGNRQELQAQTSDDEEPPGEREAAEEELRRCFRAAGAHLGQAPRSQSSACAQAAAGQQQQKQLEQQQARRQVDSMSPMQRAMEAEQEHEAADEIVKLVGRRNRMSLRYKREFFVRVVSDPRVYRASISGDINAHQSSGSLGGAQLAGGAGAPSASGPNASAPSSNNNN